MNSYEIFDKLVSRLISVVDVDIAPINSYEDCENVVSRLTSVVDVDIVPMNSYECCDNVVSRLISVVDVDIAPMNPFLTRLYLCGFMKHLPSDMFCGIFIDGYQECYFLVSQSSA